MKVKCTLLDAKKAQAPAPATLRIIDGRHGRVEPPRARGCAFELTFEEVRAAPNVVTGMFLSIILLIMFVMLKCVPSLGMFLVNSLHALLLFDSGAIRSFISCSFCRGFDMPIGELKCLLQVSIANEHEIYASSLYYDCVLEIFKVPYPIDLIPISMGDLCVIMGMNWLSRFGSIIDYKAIAW